MENIKKKHGYEFAASIPLTSVRFSLWSEDNILFDIYEGHWLIITNSSPLRICGIMYMLICSRPQSVRQHFLCKLGNSYLPHQWWRRQDLFVHDDIVCNIERVIESFPARMLPYHHLCILMPFSKYLNKAIANPTLATSTNYGACTWTCTIQVHTSLHVCFSLKCILNKITTQIYEILDM